MGGHRPLPARGGRGSGSLGQGAAEGGACLRPSRRERALSRSVPLAGLRAGRAAVRVGRPMADETFCVLPWIHAATLTDGSVQLCCVPGGGSGVNLNDQTLADYWNSTYVRDARRRMLSGRKVKACSRCYVEEALGRRSHRVVENEAWQAKLGAGGIDELTGQTAADGTLDAPPQYLDLRLGNTCNMQCVMCQPRESSRWLPTARKLSQALEGEEVKDTWDFKSSIDTNRFEWYRNPEFWSNLETFLPHVQELILAGGEPLLIK